MEIIMDQAKHNTLDFLLKKESPTDKRKSENIIDSIENKDINVDNNLITCAAIVLGNDRVKTLTAEPLLKDMYQCNDIGFISKLRYYPQHIVSSLLTIIQSMSHWDPQNPEKHSNYSNYISMLENNDISVISEKSDIKIQYPIGNYTELIKKIADFYSYTSEKEYMEVYSSLKNLVANSFKRVTRNNSNILLNNTVLSCRDNTIKLSHYSSQITFLYDRKTGRVRPNKLFASEISMSRLSAYFMCDALSLEDINTIVNISFTPLSDWIKQNTMNIDNKDYSLCID